MNTSAQSLIPPPLLTARREFYAAGPTAGVARRGHGTGANFELADQLIEVLMFLSSVEDVLFASSRSSTLRGLLNSLDSQVMA
ncbi:MAG: hypothetical protein Q8L02_01415 [Candidatus Nitrotoga sp.]|nr:hypothetical protein [Candidatus Nitrotoga sp.]